MTDRDSLLAAIVADPDSPVPRLVFADYLDEHGDPGWAELIRLQNGYFKHWTNAEEMAEREEELVAAVTARYPDPGESGVELGPPVRGFPASALFLAPGYDSAATRAVLATYPITWFRLNDIIPEFLITEGWLRRARVIDLDGYDYFHDFPPGFLDALDPAVLRGWLWRDQPLVGDDGAILLAGAPALAGLTELYLADDDIGPAGCDALIRSPHLTRLEYLDLSGNPVGDAARRLERRFGAALRLA